MLSRVIVGLTVIVAVVQGLAGDQIPGDILPLVLVLLGLVYGAACVDHDDRVSFSVLAVAVGLAATADVLGNIHYIGGYLDAIVDQVVLALLGGVVSILALGVWNALMPSDDAGDGDES